MADAKAVEVDLAPLVNKALASTELAPLLHESGVSPQTIIDRVQPRLSEILSVASEEQTVLQKTEASLKAAQLRMDEELRAPSRREWLVPSANLTVWILVSASVAVTVRWVMRTLLSVQIGLWSGWFQLSIEICVGLLVGTIAVFFLSKRWAARWEEAERVRRSQLDETLQLSALGTQAWTLRKQFEDAVYRKGIVPEVTEILGKATSPSYATELGGDVTGAGLSEVFTSALEVQTKAKSELDDLLMLPGGSIGLAGPRGAGKTTLMTLVANRPVREGKNPCSVYCPAPVAYPGRDYVVTLFLLLCTKVLQDYPRRGRAGDDFAGSRDQPLWVRDVLATLRQSLLILSASGTLLVFFGVWAAYLLMPAAPPAPVAAAPPAPVAAAPPAPVAAAPPAPVAAAPPTPVPAAPDATKQPEPGVNTSQAATSTSAGQRPLTQAPSAAKDEAAAARFLKALGIQPATLVKWGTILLAASLVVGLFFRQRFRRTRYEREREYSRERERDETTLGEVARRHLASLRFQQSYTSGWSGALKLPFGLEGGVSDAQTLARNQRSLPELVQDFRDFLRLVTAEYGRVIIAIDELDKLESDDKAHLFLNEIKAIFGVSNVFYLVSVSENAISAFERRGLPFRDVFDSSFDTIIHVDYLSLPESKRLLKRRTTRVAEPFLCLCHCLAGGLPRDLIRTARALLDVAAQEKEEKERALRPLACKVVTDEIHAKARAMIIAASKLPGGLAQTEFLSHSTNLLTESADEERLVVRAEQLLANADALRKKATSKQGGEDSAPFDMVSALALADLEAELGLYLAYVATVLEIMAFAEAATDWRSYESDGPTGANVFDSLASIRQALAVSAAVGRERLIKFRSTRGLAAGLMGSPPPPIQLSTCPPIYPAD